jgi:chaperonin GroEL
MAALDDLKMDVPDAQTGVTIVRRAMEQPMRGIVANAGMDGAVVVEAVRRHQAQEGNPYWGYDVIDNEYGDMVVKGIIDPAKVTRSAIENAASIAAMILTIEALITDIPEENAPVGAPGGGMGGMPY